MEAEALDTYLEADRLDRLKAHVALTLRAEPEQGLAQLESFRASTIVSNRTSTATITQATTNAGGRA